VSQIVLTKHAHDELIARPTGKQLVIRKALSLLKESPNSGLKLWGGYDQLYLYHSANLQIIYRIAGDQIEVIAFGEAKEYSPPPRDRITAIILAAGKANHCDVPLQLLPVDGVPMIIKVTQTFLNADIDEVIVVLGYYAAPIKSMLAGENVKVVINPHYEGPLSKSLKYGLRTVAADTSAVVLALGNQPFISPDLINELIAIYKNERANIVAPIYRGRRGHPVICHSSLIPELLKVRGDTGGREVIERHDNLLREIEMGEKSVIARIWGRLD
jgi:molybdenum cofactor cytidylyltransferase